MNFKELFFWWVDFTPKQEHIINASHGKVKFLDINKELFYRNLRITQNYCQLQQAKGEKDPARIYRSINPLVDGKPLFSFKKGHFDFDVNFGARLCTLTEWSVGHWEPESFMRTLFEQQLEMKRELQETEMGEEQVVDGDILVSMFDGSVVDGTSEVQSFGLIDENDMPPIDTWFYLLKTEDHGRILFSWIPKEVKHYANEAIQVNMLGCINWFEEEYPDAYKSILNN